MAYRTISELGSFGALDIVQIASDEVIVEQVRGEDGETSLSVDLTGLRSFIPARAVPSVTVKDNFLNVRQKHLLGNGIWGDGESRAFAVKLDKALHPSKTEISVVFTEPGDSRLIAGSGNLRLKDDALDWSGGESFFRTKRDPNSRRPVTAIMETEGPTLVLGALGPSSSKQASEDFHFMAGHVIAAIEKFVTHLILAGPGGAWDGTYWDAFRQRVAAARGMETWNEVVLECKRIDNVEECARTCANAFFDNKVFYSAMKGLFEAQVKPPVKEQEED